VKILRDACWQVGLRGVVPTASGGLPSPCITLACRHIQKSISGHPAPLRRCLGSDGWAKAGAIRSQLLSNWKRRWYPLAPHSRRGQDTTIGNSPISPFSLATGNLVALKADLVRLNLALTEAMGLEGFIPPPLVCRFILHWSLFWRQGSSGSRSRSITIAPACPSSSNSIYNCMLGMAVRTVHGFTDVCAHGY